MYRDAMTYVIRQAHYAPKIDVSMVRVLHLKITRHDLATNPGPEFGGCFVFCLVRGGMGVGCFHYMGGVWGWWWG